MKSNKIKKILALVLAAVVVVACVTAVVFVNANKKETVIIWTSAESYRIADMQECLNAQFPEYKIVIEHQSTGDHAAQLLAAGKKAECDITHDLEYAYLTTMAEKGFLADLSAYDTTRYVDGVVTSKYFLPEYRNGGAIIVNTKVLAEKNLPEPTCYEDLIKPEYKGLIAMPSPKSSGTGFMFLKSLETAWGEDAAFAYFERLNSNILDYTANGSGPVEYLSTDQTAIGLGMIAQAVVEINKGEPLKILFFDEGAPFTLYGQSVIAGREERESVRRVFDYLIDVYNYRNCQRYVPEKIYQDKDYEAEVANYPVNIHYAAMGNITYAEKQRLLSKWQYK